MKVRFLADNDLNKAIVRGVVRCDSRIDFRSAHSARLHGLDDSAVLALAAEDSRILVSHDFHTMPAHFREFAREHRSPGVLLIAQDLPVGRAIDSLLLVWEGSVAADWENRVCLVPSLATLVMA
ncbi:MAG: DUF5615 family PIN-like protein [Acidobacteria bacterium]|nr:DUF5615 family PIN-like protein [Acidobacteriota bacterium]